MTAIATSAISTFYSDPVKGLRRHADIKPYGHHDYVVEMYEHNEYVKSQIITGHTLNYVEDCAENWILGVI